MDITAIGRKGMAALLSVLFPMSLSCVASCGKKGNNGNGEQDVQSDICTERDIATAANSTGDPIGGGTGYARVTDRCDYNVDTAGQLLSCLEQALANEIVCVNDGAVIDLTGMKEISIFGGVTLAGGRGRSGSQGALIFTDELDTIPGLFVAGGENVRVTGLRIRGPDSQIRNDAYEVPNSRGIQNQYASLEVDNCEMWAWSHGGIVLLEGANSAHVHHNYIHHCRRTGLGYGIVLHGADSLIEANLFDWNRHSIAGSGIPGTSYEARYNFILENANGHSFDMHGGADRGDGTDIAGDWIRIHHNTFRTLDVSAVVIRGTPTEEALVHHNWFPYSTTSFAVRQSNGSGNMMVYDNCYAIYPFMPNPDPPDPQAGDIHAEYHLDEGQGTTTADSSSNGNDGTMMNMDPQACWTEGVGGAALKFFGGDDHVDFGAGASLSYFDDLAIEFRVNFDELDEWETILDNGLWKFFHRGGFAGDRLYFLYRIQEEESPGDSSWDGQTGVRTLTELNVGEWYHIVGVRTGNNMRIYVNGIEQNELDCLEGYTVNRDGIGNLLAGGFKGRIDDIYIYSLGGPTGNENNPPVLSWIAEPDYETDGVHPEAGDGSTMFTFKVTYSDPDNDLPETGHPRLRMFQDGEELADISPVSMMVIDDNPSDQGRSYVYSLRLPPGTGYEYAFEAIDPKGAFATGAPTQRVQGPDVN